MHEHRAEALESPAAGLRRIEGTVRELLKEFSLPPPPGLADLLRKEWAEVPAVDLSPSAIRAEEMNRLYELRARLLDWTVETGFLGFFDANPGRRYIYTRRLGVLFDMLPSLRGRRVLEVGCAAGIVAALLAPNARAYVGCDVTETALTFAERLRRALHIENARFQVADAHALPFPDGSFDVIVTTETFEHFLHPGVAIEEFSRVLAPGGIVAMTTTTAITPSDLAVKLIRAFKRDFYVDTEEQFDKKTFLAARAKNLRDPPEVFRRVHRRFGYKNLVTLFRDHGFEIRRSKGAVAAFPPVYLGVYQFLPKMVLPLVRWSEELLNEMRIFPRFGSVTTGFHLARR